VPVAWCSFVLRYVHQSSWLSKNAWWAATWLAPLLSSLFAATNTHHGLVYDHVDHDPQARAPDRLAIPRARLYAIRRALYLCRATYYGPPIRFQAVAPVAWPLLTSSRPYNDEPRLAAQMQAYNLLASTIFGLDPPVVYVSVVSSPITLCCFTNKHVGYGVVGPIPPCLTQ